MQAHIDKLRETDFVPWGFSGATSLASPANCDVLVRGRDFMAWVRRLSSRVGRRRVPGVRRAANRLELPTIQALTAKESLSRYRGIAGHLSGAAKVGRSVIRCVGCCSVTTARLYNRRHSFPEN